MKPIVRWDCGSSIRRVVVHIKLKNVSRDLRHGGEGGVGNVAIRSRPCPHAAILFQSRRLKTATDAPFLLAHGFVRCPGCSTPIESASSSWKSSL